MVENYRPIFVCREKQVNIALEQLRNTIDGKGSVLFISGELGIGKTALLDEIVHYSIREFETLVITRASCSAHSGISDAYLPFKLILRQLLEGDDKTLEKRRRDSGKEVLKILNELAPDVAGLFIPGGKVATKGILYFFTRLRYQGKEEDVRHVNQDEIFDQFASALVKLSKTRPILIVLDDVHWADEASLSLLFHLSRNITDSRVFIIAAFRPSVAESNERIRNRLDQIIREVVRYGGNRLDLDWNINSDEGKAKANHFVLEYTTQRYPDHSFPSQFLSLVTDKSGGNPLFVVELLNSLETDGSIEKEGNGWRLTKDLHTLEAIPDRLEAIIEQRVSQLASDLRSVLTCASVEGDEFTAEVLGKIKSLDEEQLLDILVQRLEKGHHLVDERGERILGKEKILSFFEFRHKLLREHLYKQMTQTEKRRLHAKVGECLEALYDNRLDEVATQLARHFYIAKDFPKALQYAMLSASNNANAFAYEDAIQNYLKALEILDSMPESHDDVRLKVLVEVGSLYKYTGDYSDSLDFLNRALDLAHRVGDKPSAAWALNNLGDIAKLMGEYEEAEQKYTQCAQLAEELGDQNLLMEISNDLSELYQAMDENFFLEDNLEGSTAWELSLKHATNVCKHAVLPQHADNLRRAHNTLGNLNRIHLEFDLAMKHFNDSLEISRKYKLKPVALNNIGECLRLQGRLDQALDSYAEYLKWAKQTGDKGAQAIALNNIALVQSAKNNFDDALEYFNASLALSLKFSYVQCAIESLTIKGKLLIEQGHMQEAQDCLTQALKLNKRDVPSEDFASVLFIVGEHMFSKGEISSATWYLERAIETKPSAGWVSEARTILEKCAHNR